MRQVYDIIGIQHYLLMKIFINLISFCISPEVWVNKCLHYENKITSIHSKNSNITEYFYY
jgi:hypothetical protein